MSGKKPPNLSNPEEQERFIEEAIGHVKVLQERYGYFTLDLDFATLLFVIAFLQLALRHPTLPAHAAGRVRKTVEDVITCLDQHEQGIGPLLRLGFNPAHDLLSEIEEQEWDRDNQPGREHWTVNRPEDKPHDP